MTPCCADGERLRTAAYRATDTWAAYRAATTAYAAYAAPLATHGGEA